MLFIITQMLGNKQHLKEAFPYVAKLLDVMDKLEDTTLEDKFGFSVLFGNYYTPAEFPEESKKLKEWARGQ